MAADNLPDFELEIVKVRKHRECGGAWVTGTIDQYQFEALVFPEHAESEDFELGRSRISKLWVWGSSRRYLLFSFDRGLDVRAANDEVQAEVDFLCEGLAQMIFGK